MKKVIALVLALVMCFALVACSNGEKEGETKNQLDTVKANGKLIVASEGTWAPWTYHDENNELVGFDVELGGLIAKKLGVEVEYVEAEWDGLFGGLDAGRYDLVINGVGYTEDRAQTYDFSDGYVFLDTVVVVRSDDDRITKPEDLNGMSTANTISSTYAQMAESYGANVTGVDDLNQTMELLIQGRIDATVNDETAFNDYLRANPDAPIKIACAISTDGYYIPVRKGETEMLAAINQALAELREDGTLAALSVKYLGSDMTAEK